MSDVSLARRTTVEISFDGVDITDSISPYLLSVSYIDNEEDESDDLQIDLQDREGLWLKNWLEKAVNAAASAVTTTTSNSNDVDTGSYATVKYGNKNSTVKTMQNYLIKLGYSLPKYGADGSFGSETKSVVTAFQKSQGLSVDGICGPKTWAALLKAINSGSTASNTTTTAKGMKIQAVICRQNWNGDGKDSVLDCGQFELDSVQASGPPSTVTLKGTSLPFTSTVRQTLKSKGWESYYLSGIAKEIAKRNGMSCMFLSSNDPYYAREEQYKTSDIDFLSRLCHDAGISLKVTNNIIVLFDQATYESKSSVITIKKDDGSYLRWQLSTGKADTEYSSCRVRYTTPNGECISATAYIDDYDADSSSNQQLEVYAKVSSATEAKTLAQKRLRLHNKFAHIVTFTMSGDPKLVAGVTVQLTGWGMWSGKYIISQAKHTVSNRGYTTQIKLRKVIVDVAPATSTTPKTYSKGDIVQFNGGYHYVSSDASKPTGSKCAAGPAKITIIKEGAAHPYHLIHTDSKSRVYGWVDGDTFS